jgi:acetyl esterase
VIQRVINRAETLGARALGRLPPPLQLALAGGRPVTKDGHTLAPDVQIILRVRELVAGEILAATPVEARQNMRRQTLLHGGPTIPVGAVRDLSVADGLRARHYAPDASGSRPLLVYFHGGGFVVGDLDTHDTPCRFLCKHARVHVLAIDYRLAPEHPFPAAVEDAHAAFLWACANAASLGADPAKVAVGGDSAGGNLSAVVAQLTKNGGPAPAAQLLLYPAVDRTWERASMELFAKGFLLTRAEVRWFTRNYTGDDPAKNADPRVSPLVAPDLSCLAPALVYTAAFDPLRDEGDAYAEALRAAGTKVRVHRCIEGLVHGFVSMAPLSRSSARAFMDVAHELASSLDA